MGRDLIKIEIVFARNPGTMIMSFFKVLSIAISPNFSGATAMCLPNHPNFSMVSFSMDGFVKTGPGQRQLTEIFSFCS